MIKIEIFRIYSKIIEIICIESFISREYYDIMNLIPTNEGVV